MVKRKSASLARVAGMLAHTELASTDPEATRKFLGAVFDWQLEDVDSPSGDKLIRYQTPGGTRGSIRKTGPKEVPAAINYILVGDIKATATRVKRAGGELLMPVVKVPQMGWFFWFRVPGGPVLAAWQDAPERKV